MLRDMYPTIHTLFTKINDIEQGEKYRYRALKESLDIVGSIQFQIEKLLEPRGLAPSVGENEKKMYYYYMGQKLRRGRRTGDGQPVSRPRGKTRLSLLF